LEGWVAGLEAYRPDLVVLPRSKGQRTDELMEWLEAQYREEKKTCGRLT
jgi:hypothetical protein